MIFNLNESLKETHHAFWISAKCDKLRVTDLLGRLLFSSRLELFHIILLLFLYDYNFWFTIKVIWLILRLCKVFVWHLNVKLRSVSIIHAVILGASFFNWERWVMIILGNKRLTCNILLTQMTWCSIKPKLLLTRHTVVLDFKGTLSV